MTPRLELLAGDDLPRLLDEAFRVLERVGVRIEDRSAAEVLLAGGAEERSGRFFLSENLVRAALATAPPRFALCDRSGAAVVELGAGRTQFNPGSAAIYRLDGGRTGREGRRPASTADVIALVQLVDDLPCYAAQSTALVPADVPEEIADRWRLLLALRHGVKPVVTGTFTREGFAPMLAMLTAVRGGERARSSG